ncbi:hypothetical protein MTO96_025559 [Rhipicephalus appendiculatus]
MYQIADKFDVSESTVHAAISRVLDFLDFISAREICWPDRDERERNKRTFMKLVRRRSGLPDVVGAIDGCHVRIARPTESEQSYYNRKKFHSIILQGVCDADMMFIDVFIGIPGRAHDSRVLQDSLLLRRSSGKVRSVMASSQAILQGNHDDDDFTFWSMFAVQQAALRDKQAQTLCIIQQLEELEEEKEHSERERNHLAVMAAQLMLHERRVWTYARPESLFETTLPHLPASAFRENFKLDVNTFRYVVSVGGSMAWQDTNMRKAIPLTKRVAIGLNRLATSAEERTAANLFGVSRSSVNIIFREFCDAIVRRLEPRFVRFPRAQEVAEDIRQFAVVAGFPQGVGALGGCHIEVCLPKEHATDYYNYKGLYSTILLAVADLRYKFMYTNVGSPGRMHDAAVFERSRLPKCWKNDLFKIEVKQMQGAPVGPVLFADQAFPLQPHLMKPYARAGPEGSSTRAFNYRLHQKENKWKIKPEQSTPPQLALWSLK